MQHHPSECCRVCLKQPHLLLFCTYSIPGTLLIVKSITLQPPPLSNFDLDAQIACGLNSGSSTHTGMQSLLCQAYLTWHRSAGAWNEPFSTALQDIVQQQDAFVCTINNQLHLAHPVHTQCHRNHMPQHLVVSCHQLEHIGLSKYVLQHAISLQTA